MRNAYPGKLYIKYTNKQSLGRKGVGTAFPRVPTEKALINAITDWYSSVSKIENPETSNSFGKKPCIISLNLKMPCPATMWHWTIHGISVFYLSICLM